jgi:hypothetical protein
LGSLRLRGKSITFGYDNKGISSYMSFLQQRKVKDHDMSVYELLQAYVFQVDHSTKEMEEPNTTQDTTDEIPPDTILDYTYIRL